ncbi:MAG: RNA ligase [Kofleriaceae bacterium]
MRVDIGAIDRTQFKVVEEAGEHLVIPLKDKFRWRDDEVHLRSLVLDANGHVLSAGFPKFFNFGEQPERDRELAAAIARGAVEWPEKLDGSLIVADRIAGVPRLRTRGRRVLGEFAPEVEALIEAEYPRLHDFLRDDPLLADHSLLFEFLHPARAIVLRAERPALYLLGYVDKHRIHPAWDAATLARISAATAIPVAPLHPLPADLDAALTHVRNWKGKEGVVARFHADDGVARLVKIKAADYLRLHAYRSRLAGARALKIAWLLDLEHADQLLPRLAPYGLDWEAAEFARPDVVPYLARRKAAHARYDALHAVIEPWLGARDKAEKRAYVERVRSYLAGADAFREDWWFTVAMRLFDANIEDARLVVDATVLDESAPSLRIWRKDPAAEIRAILTAPVREEDG